MVNVGNINIDNKIPKICTSIVGKTKDEIKTQSKEISTMDVDIVEWRCDFFNNILNFEEACNLLIEIKNILKNKPLIFTLRSIEEGGQLAIGNNEYINLYKKICDQKLVDMIDVELRLGEENIRNILLQAHNNGIKVVISKHDFNKTPSKSEMLQDLLKMQELGADIPKLAVMPENYLDVIRLLEVTCIMKEKYKDTPVITISMGKKGIISRMVGEAFGSCLTFAAGVGQSAPGQICIKDLRTSLEIINKYSDEKNNLKIILIGFMGTGKTTIGLKLSELLNINLIDIDKEIEEREEKTIDEIFSTYGQNYFRQCETNILNELLNEKEIIISSGGGIILKEENIEIMKKRGKVVLLTATAESIYERVKNDNSRPLLKNNMNMNYISKLMIEREEKYFKAADIVVDTNNKSIEEICKIIIDNL